MKKYETPVIEIITINNTDIISTSSEGTKTSVIDEIKGIWDFNQ